MSSVPWVKFIKTKVIFRYHTKGVSKSSFIKFVPQNQKLFIFKFQYESGKKRKRGKKLFELKNGAIGYYKSGQVLAITSRGKRDYK